MDFGVHLVESLHFRPELRFGKVGSFPLPAAAHSDARDLRPGCVSGHVSLDVLPFPRGLPFSEHLPHFELRIHRRVSGKRPSGFFTRDGVCRGFLILHDRFGVRRLAADFVVNQFPLLPDKPLFRNREGAGVRLNRGAAIIQCHADIRDDVPFLLSRHCDVGSL